MSSKQPAHTAYVVNDAKEGADKGAVVRDCGGLDA